MLRSILYVSQSCLTHPQAEVEVQRIVDWSIGWNASVGVTGALIFTERHFAQLIEGPAAAVLDLLDSIRRDPRHTSVTVREERDTPDRRFSEWNMVYWGPEVFLEPFILPLAGGLPVQDLDQRVEDLLALMQGLAQQERS